MRIGAHVSAAGGMRRALERAQAMGAEVAQVFTQSPRAWKPTQHDPADLAGARNSTIPVFCHATYLINLASQDPLLRERSRVALANNLAAANAMGARGLVLHPGSHRGAGLAVGVAQITAEVTAAILAQPDNTCPVLLENTAGAGDTVGRSLDEVADLLARIEVRVGEALVGVCIDTQHLWASGFDFSGTGGVDRLIEEIDRRFGLERLGLIHLNDSAVPLGANRDRHANLGEGTIGRETLAALISHRSLADVPAALEVPGPEKAGPSRADVLGAIELGRAGH